MQSLESTTRQYYSMAQIHVLRATDSFEYVLIDHGQVE